MASGIKNASRLLDFLIPLDTFIDEGFGLSFFLRDMNWIYYNWTKTIFK